MGGSAGLLLALGAAGLLVLRLLLPRRARGALPAEGKAVLITGCDKGFGHALAKHLHAKGFTVFAGCLLMDENGDGARELKNMKSDRMKVLQMDVCSDQEVAQAVDFVKRTLKEPEKGLWGLVNNAGVSTFGEVEFANLDNYKKVAEVNLWGTVRVTKAFLPLIRRAKGRVVNITSMLGRMVSPSRSCYCVSKFGVAAFSDCLRQEMYRWGVRVILVEPSNFVAATGILTAEGIDKQAEALWSGASDTVREDYGGEYFTRHVAMMKSFVNSGLKDMSLVVNDITEALTSPCPNNRYNPMETYWFFAMALGTKRGFLCMSCLLWFSLTQQGASLGFPSNHSEFGFSRSLQVLCVLTKSPKPVASPSMCCRSHGTCCSWFNSNMEPPLAAMTESL
ncbi:D-beta-hydroxybutyrate dehydrogenase, mitochondrial-like isoform X1 [Empidonax traillii]|uniref:D-beta-hydroxybutyrate dehydrogenase, mitochondrial-like isoform X1 n=1 Tax=Empidonax traillii TaxID=164674 RepID=UPI000FFD8E2E|nr:D-beta-hydroxybutyrate dehydrogenase, mitochondrial-like isoform X1 [Empidonax traillii]